MRAAVHRELVHGGAWPAELGRTYDALMELRASGDYGGVQEVSSDDAAAAVNMARRIVDAAAKVCPELRERLT